MSNTKHTPGPWSVRVHGFYRDLYSVVDADGLHICDCQGNNLGDELKNKENAALIAKAWLIPELLEALQAAQKELRFLNVKEDGQGRLNTPAYLLFLRIERLIKKATE